MKHFLRSAFIMLALFVGQYCYAEPLLGFYAWEPPTGPAGLKLRQAWLNNRNVELSLNGGSWATFANGTPTWQLTPLKTWMDEKPGLRNVVYSLWIFPESKPSLNTYTLSACAAGAYDANFQKVATGLMKGGLDSAILRIGHEFSGNWYSWSSLGQPANYAACYARIVKTLRATEPTNHWKFDWNPILQTESSQLTAAYPGDDYVDYITGDVYDVAYASEKDSLGQSTTYPYPASCTTAACRLQHQTRNWQFMLVDLNRIRDFAKAHGKPMGFPEWGVWNEGTSSLGGGDNAYFIQQMYNYITTAANNVAYGVYFDVNASGDGDHQLYGSNEFPLAAAKFVELFSAKFNLVAAMASPASVVQGSSVSLSVTLNASGDFANTNASFLLYSSTGQLLAPAYVVHPSFVSGTPTTITWKYSVPSSLAVGTYNVAVQVNDTSYTKLLFYKDRAINFNVTKKPATYSLSGTAINLKTATAGETVTMQTSFTSSVDVPNAHFVLMLTSSVTGAQILNESSSQTANLKAGVPFVLIYTYKMPSGSKAGVYGISLNVTDENWKTLFYKSGVSSFTVVSP